MSVSQQPLSLFRALILNRLFLSDCFLASFQGRFRKNLEGAKLVSRNGFKHYTGGGDRAGGGGKKIGNPRHDQELSNVVLAFSGGSSSRSVYSLSLSASFVVRGES